MAQWNLSVDIRGQGTDLAAKLRASATQARSLATAARSAKTEVRGLGTASTAAAAKLQRTATQAGRVSRQLRQLAADADRAERRLRAIRSNVRVQVRLDDQTAAGAAAIRARLASLGGNNVNLTANLRAGNTAAAAAALRAADDAAQDLSRTLRTLRGRAAASAASLDELRARAIAAAGGMRSLNTTLRTSDTRMNSLSDGTRTLTTRMGELDGVTARVAGNLRGIRGGLGSVSTAAGNTNRHTRLLVEGAVALATALIPVAAAAVPIAAGMTAAGVAAGAFGVALAGQIKHLVDAAEAQTKYKEAVEENGQFSKEAIEAQMKYARQMQKLPAPTREAAAAFQLLKDRYKDFSTQLSDSTMPAATKTFGIFSRLLVDSVPLARTFGDGLDRTATIIAGGLQTDSWHGFMQEVNDFTRDTLARANHALVKFTTGLDTGEVGGNLREFMAYAKANGPLVGDTLEELGDALIHILVAASDVGVGVLQVVDVLAKLVNAVPTSVISTFLQLYAAMKLITLAAGALTAVASAGAIARLGAYFQLMRVAGVAPTLRATAASMTAMTKASIGLGVLAGVAYGIDKLAKHARGAPPDVDRLTTSLKNLSQTGEFSGELKKTFTDLDGLVEKIELLDTKTKDLEKSREGGALGMGRIPVLDDIGDWVSDRILDMDQGGESITALAEDFKGLDSALAGLVSSGHTDVASKSFDLIAAAAKRQGISLDEVNKLLPNYRDAVAAAAAEQELAAAAMGIFGQQAMETKGKLDAQKASAEGLRQAIINLNDTNRAAYDSQIQFEQSIDDLTKAFKDNGATLDINSEKGRKNGTAMSQAAKAHDDMVTAGIAAGESLGSMTKKSDKLREQMMKLATDAFDGNKKKAKQYVDTLLGVPGEIKTLVQLERDQAIAGLQEVQGEIQKTPGAKSVTVSTLNAAAIRALEAVGLKTRTLPDGRTEVYTANGQAIGAISYVLQALNNLNGTTAHTSVITTYKIRGNPNIPSGTYHGSTAGRSADGNIYGPARVHRFADGGMRENHVAQIAQPTFRMWAEPETGGEAYIPFATSKRPRSRAIAEETVRRLGGDPQAIQWNANGSVTDWRYDPQTGSLFSTSDSIAAGKKKTKKGKEYLDLAAVEKSLKSVAGATRRWNADLQTVADRAGGDVAEALAAMGKDGIELTRKMAHGSTKYLTEMSNALRGLAATAKASLTDYTRQLTLANQVDATFAKNLAILAGRGHGDLAKQLAAQGDKAATELAAAAVSDNKKATSANAAAKNANSALTGEQVQQLVAIIAAVKTSKTGIHDVAASTGLGEDEIIAVASKATAQIQSSLGGRSDKFLSDLARANKGMSYATGGIREGIYAMQGGLVRWAEPSTGGEAYIPLGANKRRNATRVLRDVATRFGIGLTDMSASRQVVVVKEGGDTHVTVTPVRTGASATDIGYQVGRSVRRARRGGVAARA